MASYASNESSYARTSDFLKWLNGRPGTTISRKIEVADLRAHNAGRGIVAVDNIEEDEELFTITKSDVLTVQNSTLQQIKPRLLERLDSWNSLVLVMIHEDGLAEQSKWWNYLQMLPTQFDTLIYWAPSELAELEGCAVLNKIKKDAADDSFRMSLLPVVQQQPELFGRYAQEFGGSNASTVLLNLAHRMATLIMAYGFDIEPDFSSSEEEYDEEEADGSSQLAYELNKGMVPLADLCNAEGDLNNAHLIRHGDSKMIMVALTPISKGQQIFNDYGQLPRSDLLRRYGYVTENYKKWDVVEVDIESIISAAKKHNKLDDREQNLRLELAGKWEALQDGYDLSRPPHDQRFEFESSLILTITALLLDTDAAKQAAASIETPNHPPLSLLTTLGLLLKEIISHRQKAYKTTRAEDLALLEDPTVQGRWRMAIEVRLGEKEILAMAALRVDETIADIGRKAPHTSHVKRGL